MKKIMKTFNEMDVETVIEAIVLNLTCELTCACDAGADEDAQKIKTALEVLTNGDQQIFISNVTETATDIWNSPVCMVANPEKLNMVKLK